MDDSRFVSHEPCPACNSKDNLARYSDGHAFCFGCGHWDAGDGTSKDKPVTKNAAFISMTPADLPKRRLTRETCAKFGYGIGDYRGQRVQVAVYRSEDGTPVAQKIRTADKQFRIIGQGSELPLFGQHLWRSSGKKVVVCEGEIDAMSVSQAHGNKWPVVSVPNGASSAGAAVKRALPWLESFETVVFMFDMDEPGQKAAKECAALLTPGRAKIAVLPLKDASEMMMASRVSEIVNCVWEAKVYRPDGVILGEELRDRVLANQEDTDSIPYPWQSLNEMTLGIRLGEIVTLTSGTGQGKSSVCRAWQHYLIGKGQKVGVMALEENVIKTSKALMGIELRCPPQRWDQHQFGLEELEAAFDATVGSGRVVLYDHFGSTDTENLLSRVRYMVRSCGCSHVFLDHLSIVVSGIGDGDERRLIDNTMTRLRSLVEELQFCLFVVSHLTRPPGTGTAHEEGGSTSLRQLRGSGAIGQLSDIVIGLERNQQDEENKDITRLRVLKNRWTGETGLSSVLRYDRLTGLLSETAFIEEPSSDDAPF
jgi:twinkle protein